MFILTNIAYLKLSKLIKRFLFVNPFHLLIKWLLSSQDWKIVMVHVLFYFSLVS